MDFERFIRTGLQHVLLAACDEVRGELAGNRLRVERLCQESGLAIADCRSCWLQIDIGAGPYSLPRSIHVSTSEGSVISFFSLSRAVFPVQAVPPRLMIDLLHWNVGNGDTGAWGLCVSEDDRATFAMTYSAFSAALTAEQFRHVCTRLATETARLDDFLARAGVRM
jgi:hypothetical protein